MNLPDTIKKYYDLRNSDGYQLMHKIKEQEISFLVFQGNYIELKEILEYHNDSINKDEIWKTADSRWKVQRKVIRYMHNYFASAMSLVDHTTKHKKLHSNIRGFKEEYQAKVDSEFKDSNLHNFIKEFRNFIIHYKIPKVLSKQRILSENERQTSFRIYKNELSGYNWNSRAKEYKDSLEDKFELEDIVDEYYKKVSDFNNWYQKKQREFHIDIFKELTKKKRELMNYANEENLNHIVNFNMEDIEEDERLIDELTQINLKNLQPEALY